MTIIMNDSHIVSIAQIREFLKVGRDIEFRGSSQKGKYQWIEEILLRFRYFSLPKREKSLARRYLMGMTGYSDAQTTRLIARKKKLGKIIPSARRHHCFPKKYAAEDVAYLIETDNLHQRLSGPATKKILEREYSMFKKDEYASISRISS